MKTQIKLRSEQVLEMQFNEQNFEAKPRFRKGEGYFLPPVFSPEGLKGKLHRNAMRVGFPYIRKSGSSGEMVSKTKRFIVLENDRFEVSVCPDWGGRLTSIWDKKIQRELLWTSPSIKNVNMGLNGAWTIGGVEWNCSRVGHCVHGAYNIGYERVTLENGEEGIRFGATDELFETSWQVTLVLGANQVHCRIRIENHSEEVQPLYWWSNIAAPAGKSVRLMYQPGPVLNHTMFYDPCYNEMIWPNFKGRDASDWTQHDENISAYFHQYQSDYFGYFEKNEKWAFYHRADHRRVKGRKLWSLGAYHVHPVWWARIAEPAWAPYVEIQSGLNPVQVDCESLHPKEVVEWTESYGAIPLEAPELYAEAFQIFEQEAAKDFRPYEAAQSEAFWKVKKIECGLSPELRVQISAKIVRNLEVTEAELDEVIHSGWVGGKSWVAYLENLQKQGKITPRRSVSYASALIDQGRADEAKALLIPLIDQKGVDSGLAHYLYGLIEWGENQLDLAVKHLLHATQKAPDLLMVYTTLDSIFESQGQWEKRKALWAGASESIRHSDDYRHSQAKVAFIEGRWDDVREQLKEPLFSCGEGGFNPWRLYRESFIAEGLEAELRGDFPTALLKLSAAAEERPQFTVGREEAQLSMDLFYYRWKISMKSGDPTQARSLLSHAMRFNQQAYMPEAVYAYRLAKESGDRSEKMRLLEIQEWNQKGETKTNELYPVRDCVWQTCEGNLKGWKSLENDFLYRYRAAWELARL